MSAGRPPGTGSILTQEESEAIAKKVLSHTTKPAAVHVLTRNIQNSRFARSEITTQLDRTDGRITVTSIAGDQTAQGRTLDFGDDAIREAVRVAEAAAEGAPGEYDPVTMLKPRSYPKPPGLWHESTRGVTIPDRTAGIMDSMRRTEGFVAAGTLDVAAASQLVANSEGLTGYCRDTRSSFQVTARSKDNTGSGWAGKQSNDFSELSPARIGERAADKSERSRNPSATEPGRYTAILEPQAYADMVNLMMMFHMPLELAERGITVFADPSGGTKVGKRMLDPRLSLVSDPMDPDGPFCPFSEGSDPYDRTYWMREGILENLSYGNAVAMERGREYGVANPLSVRLEPAPGTKLATVDEMIETCDRGIYVTRLTTSFADFRHLVFTGVTRDGTWLIEGGKITRPIQNLRYLDSHLFFLNNLEMVGKPELVVHGPQFVLPPVRVRDFNFTAIANAV